VGKDGEDPLGTMLATPLFDALVLRSTYVRVVAAVWTGGGGVRASSSGLGKSCFSSWRRRDLWPNRCQHAGADPRPRVGGGVSIR